MGHTVRRICRNPLADRSAHRQTAESETRNPKAVGQTENIAAQQSNRVLARRGVRCTVSASVIAQDLKVAQQIRHLRLPHRMVGSDRMGKNQHWPSRRSLKAIKRSRILNGGKGQSYCSLSVSECRRELESNASRNSSAEPRYCSGTSSC